MDSEWATYQESVNCTQGMVKGTFGRTFGEKLHHSVLSFHVPLGDFHDFFVAGVVGQGVQGLHAFHVLRGHNIFRVHFIPGLIAIAIPNGWCVLPW